MSKVYPFTYNRQIERYLGQFGRVFAGFQVEDGVERNGTRHRKQVPVVYGSVSRIIGSIINKRDALSNQSLPIMSFYLSGIEKNQEEKKSQYHQDDIAYKNASGANTAFSRLIGPSFNMRVELNILASSASELYSILEQILLVFNPRVTIQTDNSIMNDNYITEIMLDSISNEINFPTGTERQVVQQSLSFSVPIRLSYPVNPDSPIIETIRARIFADSEATLENMVWEEVITGEDE